jgi:hypothetical protein
LDGKTLHYRKNESTLAALLELDSAVNEFNRLSMMVNLGAIPGPRSIARREMGMKLAAIRQEILKKLQLVSSDERR